MYFRRLPAVLAAMALISCNRTTEDMARFAVNTKVSQVELFSDNNEFDYVAVFDRAGHLATIWYYEGLPDTAGCDFESVPDIADFDNFLGFEATHGEFRYYEACEYNSKGQLIAKSDVNSANETEGRYEFDYEDGKVSDCRFYGMNNELLNEWVHRRHDGKVSTDFYHEGMLSYLSEKDSDALEFNEYVVGLDGDSLVVASNHFENYAEGKPSRIVGGDIDLSVEYDGNGLPVHTVNVQMSSFCEIYYSPSLETLPERWYVYEYDEKGNWIVRSEYADPEQSMLMGTISRKITY